MENLVLMAKTLDLIYESLAKPKKSLLELDYETLPRRLSTYDRDSRDVDRRPQEPVLRVMQENKGRFGGFFFR